MTLIILNKSPKKDILSTSFVFETTKNIIRRATFRTRGPESVMSSITRGLDELNYKYLLNPSLDKIKDGDVVWVNGSIPALKFAIELKKDKKIKLIAGPNLVVLPTEMDGIIFNPAVDVVLQPSEWTKKLYTRYYPESEDKIKIWAAGVQVPTIPNERNSRRPHIIVFQKNAPEPLLNKVIDVVSANKINYSIVKYGNFKHEDLLETLNKSTGMIYLSSSESQGIVLQETWIRDIPTLVWDTGVWTYMNTKFEHEQISCPYLNDKSGMTFEGISDFEQKYNTFSNSIKDFEPRNSIINTLSDNASAKSFINIIESL